MRAKWTSLSSTDDGARNAAAWPAFARSFCGSGPEMKFEGPLEGREVSNRPARTDINYDVRISCDAGEFEAQIVNLSAMGFRLRSEAALEVGWNVSLTVASLAPVGA